MGGPLSLYIFQLMSDGFYRALLKCFRAAPPPPPPLWVHCPHERVTRDGSPPPALLVAPKKKNSSTLQSKSHAIEIEVCMALVFQPKPHRTKTTASDQFLLHYFVEGGGEGEWTINKLQISVLAGEGENSLQPTRPVWASWIKPVPYGARLDVQFCVFKGWWIFYDVWITCCAFFSWEPHNHTVQIPH